ncbi:MAG: c-type cytochrome [Myxococcota bacterium]
MRWVALLLLLGCSARRTEPIAGPLVLEGEAARGEQVFMRACHSCHPFGEGGLGLAINNKPLPGFLLRAQVRVGFGTMPAFDEGRISREELDALVVYLKRLRRHR